MDPTFKQEILVFTDAACSGNPGPAGIGVVLVCGSHRRELTEHIGTATSNIAKLTAVARALSAIRERDRPVVVYSDSEYAIGAVTKSWRVRTNQQLVEYARLLAADYSNLYFDAPPLPGHADDECRCKALARMALTQGAAPPAQARRAFDDREDRPDAPDELSLF